MTALIALLGAGVGLGVFLCIGGSTGTPRAGSQDLSVRHLGEPRSFGPSSALGVCLVLTRWPVAAVAGGALGWFSPELLGGRAAREHATGRTEAIAIVDRDAARHDRRRARPRGRDRGDLARRARPDPARGPHFAIAVEREPLPRALAQLADDLAHPIADLVVASLTMAATESVRELTDLLGTLAATARDEAAMQLRVEAARARMRTAVRVITGCTVATAVGLVVLNPSYVDVYSTPLGQMTLALIVVCWGVALWWLARMSRFRSPERFLLHATQAAEATR